nr:zinc finger protein OZF-like [Aedes albopictus]
MDLSNRCRGCLSNDEDTLRPLENAPTAKMFEDCVGLKLSTGPGLPRNICGTCYGKCTSWSKFKQQCLETDALLQFKFEHLKKTEPSVVDDKEVVEPEDDEVQPIADRGLENNGEESPETIVEEEKDLEEEYDIVAPEQIETGVEEIQENDEQDMNQEIEIEVTDGDPDDEEYDVKATVVEEFYLSEEEQTVHDTGEDIEEEIVQEEVVSVENSEQQVVGKRMDISCDKCSMRFRSAERFEAHQREHQGLKPEVCKVCSDEFNSARALWRHMNKHGDVKKHVCKECGKCYKFATSLTLHRKTHRDEKLHICDTCGKSFVRAHGLKSHLLTHVNETPFECDKCQKQFKNLTMLRNHVVRVHEAIKNFICSECDKPFATGAELKIHQRSHTNQRPFKCSSCNKAFKTQSHLSVHFRAAHTSDRPYVCEICPRKFAHSKVLKQHRLTHAAEGPWKCHICEKTFRQRKTLIGHMSQHERASPIDEFIIESVVKLPETLTTLE